MQFIIGLGNPGKEYELTRHNVGFMALDFICKLHDVEIVSESKKFDAVIKEIGMVDGSAKNFLVYPQTYMNESGKSVRQILDFYKLTPKDILVLHDDVDLPLGTIKFTENSGSAGHNGVSSLIEELGTTEFRRIRIGVESREDKTQLPTDKFVLQNFSEEEVKLIPFQEISIKTFIQLKIK